MFGQTKERQEIIDIMVKMTEVVLTVLTILSFLKGIWVSLDMDESYAVALGYRMAAGDRLVRDMWEPHQFSGFLAAIFTVVHVRIWGSTEYLIVFLRVVGVFIHTALGIALYHQLRKERKQFSAFCIVVLHLNFLPKWIQMPEFELMHYWCLLGIFILLSAYFTAEKPRRILPVAGGILLVGAVLCYPTMILLYPFYILALYVLEKQRAWQREGWKALWRSSVLFTLGALLSGGIFLAYLFSYMSLDELKRYVSYIFLDTSHGIYTMGEKWAIYLEEMGVQAGFYGQYLLLAAGLTLAVGGIGCLSFRRKRLDDSAVGGEEGSAARTGGSCGGARESVAAWAGRWLVAVLVAAAALMQVNAIYGFLFEDKNQFYFQVRYLAVLLPGIVLGVRGRRRMARWLYLLVLPGIVSVPLVLTVINMDTNVAYAKAFVGVLGSLLILDQYCGELAESTVWKKAASFLWYVAGGMLLAGILVCRLVLIRVSGCLPVTVKASLEKMEAGPEKGIWVLADTAETWNRNYQDLEQYIRKDDRVLYIGAESLAYVEMGALAATPSMQGTTVFNEMFLYYYEEHPDRVPNVIVYDKTFGEHPVYALSYALSLQEPALFCWIEQNYEGADIVETEHLIIVRIMELKSASGCGFRLADMDRCTR